MIHLYEKIAHSLEERRKELSTAFPLPGEFELAQEFKTSRETIRRALKKLEDEGAVTRRRGVGSFLQPPNPAGGHLAGQTVGVIPPPWMDEAGGWYSSIIYEGIGRWASANDCHFTILPAVNRAASTHEWITGTRRLGLAGLIWIHPQSAQVDLIQSTARFLPTVALGRQIPGDHLHSILPNYDTMATLIDDYLVEKGLSTYAVIGKNVYDPLTQAWIEAVTKAHERRGALFAPAHYHFDYQCFHLTQLADLLFDFYLKAHPDVQALVFPSSGSLQTLLANPRFRKAMEDGLPVVTTNYGPYPIDSLLPGQTIPHVKADWAAIAYKAMGQLSQIAAGSRPSRPTMESVQMIRA